MAIFLLELIRTEIDGYIISLTDHKAENRPQSLCQRIQRWGYKL